MAKKDLKNTAGGARGVRTVDGELVMIERGATAKGLDVSAEELKAVKAIGIVPAGSAAADEDEDDGAGEGSGEGNGPLDGSLPDLKAHLETVDDRAVLEQLGKDEAAGKNRTGALGAIQARIDALPAA